MAPLSGRVFLFLLLLLSIVGFSRGYGQAAGTGCGVRYFKGSYALPANENISLLSTAIGADGSIYLGCIANSSYSIIKLDSSGNLIRTTSYLPAGIAKSDGPGKSIIDHDGNLFSVFSNNYIIQTDTAGNVLSARQLSTPGTSIQLQEFSMLANGDKVFVFFGRDANGRICNYLLVTNPDASAIKWTKYLYGNTYNHCHVLADGNKIVVSTDLVISNNINIGTGIIQFDAGNGTILHQQWFDQLISSNQIAHYDNGYIFAGNSQTPNICGFYARMDNALNLISIHNFPPYFDNGIVYHYLLQPQADGSVYGVSSHPNAMNLFRINASDVIDWTSGMLPPVYPTTPKSITLAASGILIGTDLTTNSGLKVLNPAIQLYKGSYAGYFPSCANPVTRTTSMAALPVTKKNPFTQFRDTTGFMSNQITVQATKPILTGGICADQPACNSVKIVGNPVVCGTSGTFVANTNNGCSLPVTWSVTSDIGTGTVQSAGINAVTIQFSGEGIYKVKAFINANCSIFADSILVNVNTGSQVVLGNDTLLCAGDSLRLRAGNNFSTYLWQDGSTDSTFLVKNPGQFTVTATDYCGNVRSSSMNVSFRAAVASPFPATISKCPADTLHLPLPQGFDSVYFSTALAGARILNNTVQFFNKTTSSFTVRERDNNRCIVNSPIVVHIYDVPMLNIGNDTTICTGNFIQLDAGAAFNNFHWSNGGTGRAISANQAGKYWVQGSSANGCVVSDTLTLALYPLLIVHLNPDTLLCAGTTRLLSAGSQFASYLWNDGSTASALRVSSTGQYWVHVTNKQGCVAADTTVIKGIVLPPSIFLPQDTAICQFGTVTLQAKSKFNSYLWNDGSKSPSLPVYSEGIYSLQVVDENGCTGSDSIVVAGKQCMIGFFMPNGFTPNNDGTNDILRPRIYGKVISYSFIVYNRWGQQVFASSEPLKGWNGTLGDNQQPAGGFVWYCRYQLQGEEVKIQRGMVMLIR